MTNLTASRIRLTETKCKLYAEYNVYKKSDLDEKVTDYWGNQC